MDGKRNRNSVNGDEEWVELFVDWSRSCERGLLRIAIGLAVLLLLAQAVLRVPALRPLLTEAEREMGEAAEPAEPSSAFADPFGGVV
jgi:hypothetical protein